jgi:hypothetical protein
MMKTNPGFLIPVCATFVLLMAFGLARSAAASSCTCNDVRDLQARYCLAREMVNEWDRLIRWTQFGETKSNSVEMLGNDNRGEVRTCADQVAFIAKESFVDPRPNDRPVKSQQNEGKTDDNCNITVTATSACMKEVITDHESWHQQICRIRSAPNAAVDGPLDFFRQVAVEMGQWRAGQSLISYMMEEREGYSRELLSIADKLKDLAGKCPSSRNFGSDKPGRSFTIAPCPRIDYRQYDRRPKCPRM